MVEITKRKSYEIKMVYHVTAMHKSGNMLRQDISVFEKIEKDSNEYYELCRLAKKENLLAIDIAEIFKSKLDENMKVLKQNISECYKREEAKGTIEFDSIAVYKMDDFSSFSLTYDIYIDNEKM